MKRSGCVKEGVGARYKVELIHVSACICLCFQGRVSWNPVVIFSSSGSTVQIIDIVSAAHLSNRKFHGIHCSVCYPAATTMEHVQVSRKSKLAT